MAGARRAFAETVTAAVNDLIERGYESKEQLGAWLTRLNAAARDALVPESELVRSLRGSLLFEYDRALRPARLVQTHPGVSAFTLQKVKPALRAELDRRILASASLIKLNREASIQRTLQRFAGWATSIPAGGTEVAKRKKVKDEVKRAIGGLPFIERRVVIDQGHKLVAAINDIVATDGGAIAGVWSSHWREAGYDYRPEHKARDGKVYLIRDSWAVKDGYVKKSGVEYLDEITQPGEEVSCRCYVRYVYSLRDLPRDWLTVKGREALKEIGHAA